MGSVYEEFQEELRRLGQKYADNPRKELIQLFLVALEREEIVSVGYRESLMTDRLSRMPIADDVREIIHHALVWIWKDEEMHSIYIRGAILKLGSMRLRIQAFLTQTAGGVGGWASSVLQHSRWRNAPISRGLASTIAAIGGLLGKLPHEVRQHLKHGPFRNFCLFNIQAEKTAAICWRRITELARDQSDLEQQLIEDFRRVANDEDRHERIFSILAEVLDEDDRLVYPTDVATLEQRIREVGEEFLPRSRRNVNDIQNPLGSGGKVWSFAGKSLSEKRQLFQRLLRESDLQLRIEARANWLHKSIHDMRIVIKPTFMLGYSHRDVSPITDPSLVEDLAKYLHELGCTDVAVLEGTNIYDHFFQNRSVENVASYFGICSDNYRIVNATQEQVPHSYKRGMAQYSISHSWRDADFRISFPKLRSHPIELALLSIGNIEWVGGRCDEYLFVERQASRATAVMMLLDEFPPHYALIDGYDSAPDGLVGVMGCARPKSPMRFYAGGDALAVDIVSARHAGIADPRDSSILHAACHWFGGWAEKIIIVGTDEPIARWRGPYSNELWSLLSIMAYPVYVMGSGRGSLFVPEMDLDAFPHIRPEGFWLRLGRSSVRWLLGLKLPRSPAERSG